MSELKNPAAQAMRALVKRENLIRTPEQCRKGALAAAKAKREKRRNKKKDSAQDVGLVVSTATQ